MYAFSRANAQMLCTAVSESMVVLYVGIDQVKNGHMYLRYMGAALRKPQPSTAKLLQIKTLLILLLEMPKEFCYPTQNWSMQVNYIGCLENENQLLYALQKKQYVFMDIQW